MLFGISKEERHEFVSQFDKTEPKTVFVIGNLPARMKVKFAQDAAQQSLENPGKFQFRGDMTEIVLMGLKEIKGEGKPITEITEDLLSRLPMEILIELANEIFKANALSSEEKKKLILSIWSMQNGLDCRFCTDQLRVIRGHDGFSAPRMVAGVEVERCPMFFVSDAEHLKIETYSHYKNGFLPNEGGWLDQPMKFVDMMIVIASAIQELTEKEKDGNPKSYYRDVT